jgi:RNA polymerase sigma factor (sigma-70 family)
MRSRTLRPLLHSLYCFSAVKGSDPRTDSDLLECFARRRDSEAFAALVHRHGPMVLAVCQRLLADRHEAEDAFQATFLVLVRKSAALRQPHQLAAWLHGVARRIALRLRRRAARRQPIPEGLDLAEGRCLEPLERAIWQEVRTILDEEIERLPSKYRLPVVLCYLQGQSYTEAARSLGWPAGTVSVRLARARQQLHDRFVRRGLRAPASLPGGLLGQEALASPVPAALLTATVHTATCCVGGVTALAGVSQQVIALAEGALRTMWVTKFKMTLLVVLVCAGLGGLAWHQGPRVQAQAPAGASDERPQAAADGEPGDDKDLEVLERQLQALKQQIEERRRQIYSHRQGGALEQIEGALKKLTQANADSPERSAAVKEFAQAFGRLKLALAGRPVADYRQEYTRYVNRLRLAQAPGMVGIVTDGRVLQVDLERKEALLSAGTKDGVQKGQLYRVYQSGKASPDQTGWVRIIEADSKWSIARIVQEYSPRAPMRANDIIQLHDGKEPEGLERRQ